MGIFNVFKHNKKFFESVKRDSNHITNICKKNVELNGTIQEQNQLYLNVYFSVCNYYRSVLISKGMSQKDVFVLLFNNICNFSDALGIPYTNDNNPLFEMFCKVMDSHNFHAMSIDSNNIDEGYRFAKATMLCIVPPNCIELYSRDKMERTIDEIRLYFNDVMKENKI